MPEVGVSEREIASKLSSCEVSRCEVSIRSSSMKFFVRIDMKHSYFSNYFIICLQSIFSVVEIIIELFVVCQKLIRVI